MRTIAVLIGLQYSYMRDALRGIAEFLADKPGWRLDAAAMRLSSVERLGTVQPDGIIAHAIWPEWLERPELRGRPACTLFEATPIGRAMNATSDNIVLGRLATEHLVECGFEHFGFVAPDSEWNRLRLQGMCEALDKPAGELSVLLGGQAAAAESPWWYGAKWPDKLGPWLAEQPKPLGLVTGSPAFAYGVCDVCRDQGLRVPEDVAVVSIGDDDVLCRITHPLVSSALIPWEAIGYEAARQLTRRIEGDADVPQQIIVPPVGVLPRGSTDTSATTDEIILKAGRYIREHYPNVSLKIGQVARHVGLSQRTLERRFRSRLGWSILQEIRRVRVNHIKQMLAETELSTDVIAKRAGVRSMSYLATMFRQAVGQSPTQFREQFRLPADPSA